MAVRRALRGSRNGAGSGVLLPRSCFMPLFDRRYSALKTSIPATMSASPTPWRHVSGIFSQPMSPRASIAAAPAAAEEKSSTISRGHITVDEAKRCAMKNGDEVELTMKEFDLILFLMKNPGKVYSREALLDLVWGYDYQGDTRTVDVHIRRLREKLELNPAQPEYIITKWGVGYYFAD